MTSQRVGLRSLLAIGLFSLGVGASRPRLAWCKDATGPVSSSSDVPDPTAKSAVRGDRDDGVLSPDTGATAQASIVLIGPHDATELETLIRELLARDNVTCEFARAESFRTEALFEGSARNRKLTVFVRTEVEPGLAQLYFRGSFGKRYLLRSLRLANGLDDVGRESIAQIVESSVLALLSSSAGMDRHQAQSALLGAAPSGRAASLDTARTRFETRSRAAARTSYWLHLRYGIAVGGPPFGVGQGPGAELAFATRRLPRLRARLSGEYLLVRRLVTDVVAVEVQDSSVLLAVDWSMPIDDSQSLIASLGAGIQRTRMTPGSVQADVTPSPALTRFGLVMRPEVRYEVAYGPLGFALAGFSDIAGTNTRYELLDDGKRTPLATPRRLRLGAAVLAGVHFF